MAYYGGDNNDNLINGSTGADTIQGNGGNDTLNGLAGSDSIYGGDGNDRLTGGVGNDYLQGNAGADTYVFSKIDGQDEIYNYDSDNSVDVVQFIDLASTGITAIFRSANTYNLVLQYGAGGQLTIDNYFYQIDPAYRVNQFQFTNVAWTLADIAQRYNGSSSADYLQAFDGMINKINGLGGDDQIYGGNSNDTLTGGAGNDSLYGQAGNDTLNGGDGTDYLQGDAGSDILNGGAGADTLKGGANGDTYLFAYGGGKDTIYNADGETFGVANQDVVKITGAARSDVALGRTPGTTDLTIGLKNATTGAIYDTLTVANYFIYAQNTSQDANWTVSKIVFSDGTWVSGYGFGVVATGNAATASTLYGANGNDTLTGQAPGDTLVGFGGADTLNGGGGNDTLYGDMAGNNTFGGLSTAAGNDILNGGDGADYLAGEGGNDTLNGGTGNDTLNGGTGNDTLNGGTGNDSMYGGTGNDTYVVDSPSDYAGENTGEGIDTVRSTVTWTLGSNQENLILIGTASINGTGNPLNNTLTGNSANNILDGGLGNDWLNGGAGADTLNGGDGNDTLKGGDGNDILNGGTGIDTLNGGAGTDSFVFGTLAGGADGVQDFLSGVDKLRLLDGAAGLAIGNGDHVINNAKVINAPGGFANSAELVIVTPNIAGAITATSAAAAIGSASSAYTIGNIRLFAVDNGTDSAIFRFQAADADAAVEANELSLVVTLQGTAQTVFADYAFA
jgi:Ca2+-binding RTX toxin-like protein